MKGGRIEQSAPRNNSPSLSSIQKNTKNSQSEILKKLESALQLQREDLAKVAYQSALKIESTDINFLIKVGDFAMKQEELSIALELFKRVLRIETKKAEIWIKYLDCLIGLGELEEAQEKLDYLIRSGAKGRALEGLVKKVRSISEKDKLTENQKTFQNNKSLTELIDLASEKISQDDLDSAISIYQKILRLKSDIPAVYNNLGLLFHQKKEYSLAIEMYQKTIETDPGSPEAYFNLANLYREVKNLKLAFSKNAYRLTNNIINILFLVFIVLKH